MAEAKAPKKLAIIDGKSVFYRGYYAMPNLATKEGMPTGGVYGFAAMALEVVKRLKPDYVAVAWDKPKTNIRRRLELYPEYKAGRKPAPITAEAARTRVFQMRAASDAIMVGIGTVLSDKPQLTCRLPGMAERSPVRVVLDAKLKLPLMTSVVATVRDTPTWVFTSAKPSTIAEEILQHKGCKVFRVGDVDVQLDLAEVLKVLADQGITRLMVEGGPKVAGAMAAAGLVDELALLRGAKTIGADGIAPLEGLPLDGFAGQLQAHGREQLGSDTLETYERA